MHRVSFRARSPYAPNVHEICRTVITVKSAAAVAATPVPIAPIAPEVSFCPGVIDVQLQPNERARIVHWREPTFRSHHKLKQLFKTKPSGSHFAAGVHRISYVATDVNNLQARCDFTINIKPAPRKSYFYPPNWRAHRLTEFSHFTSETASSRLVNPAAATYGSALANHESYLLCPNKPAMKLDTSFPVSRVRVFYRKLTNRHANLKSIQNMVHIERGDDSRPRNLIDIYHWSLD